MRKRLLVRMVLGIVIALSAACSMASAAGNEAFDNVFESSSGFKFSMNNPPFGLDYTRKEMMEAPDSIDRALTGALYNLYEYEVYREKKDVNDSIALEIYNSVYKGWFNGYAVVRDGQQGESDSSFNIFMIWSRQKNQGLGKMLWMDYDGKTRTLRGIAESIRAVESEAELREDFTAVKYTEAAMGGSRSTADDVYFSPVVTSGENLIHDFDVAYMMNHYGQMPPFSDFEPNTNLASLIVPDDTYRNLGRPMDDLIADHDSIRIITKPSQYLDKEVGELYEETGEMILVGAGVAWYNLLNHEIRKSGKKLEATYAAEIYRGLKNGPGIMLFGAKGLEEDYFNIVFATTDNLNKRHANVFWFEWDIETQYIRFIRFELPYQTEITSDEDLIADGSPLDPFIVACCYDESRNEDASSWIFRVYGNSGNAVITNYIEGIYEDISGDRLQLDAGKADSGKTAIRNDADVRTVIIRSNGDVNVRQGPDKNTKKLGTAKAGMIYTLLDTAGNGWLKIRLEDGTEGYISPKMVQ